MPEYEYRAKVGPDKITEGVLSAPTESVAIEKIHQMGLVPVRVGLYHPKGSGHGRLELRGVLSFERKRLAFFSRYLASFLRSGIPLLRALDILAEQERDVSFRSIVEQLALHVKRGRTLSGAMEQFPKIFFPTYVAMIRAGEAGGALHEALGKMADHLKKESLTIAKVKQALIYPVFLTLTGFGTVAFVLGFVIPKISVVFRQTGQPLPWATRVVMACGVFLNHYWFWVLAVFAVVFMAAAQFVKRPAGKRFSDHLTLKVPFLGDLVFKAALARFTRTLSLSLSNGIPFLEGLRVAIPTLNNDVIGEAMQGCYQWVQKGDRFGKRLRQLSLIPPFMADLIMAGEESGNLSESLGEIADTYERETDEAAQIFTSCFEPLVILCFGSVLGFVVIAMLLPIFEMSLFVQ